LQEVYAVALGVGLALAVEQVIDPGRPGVPLRPQTLLPFFSYVITGFPLYHWAVRFLDLSEQDGPPSRGAIMTSLVIGSTELLLLLALAVLVARPFVFLVSFAGVLAFEAVAGATLLALGAYGANDGFGRRYITLHVICLGVAIVGVAATELVWSSQMAVASGLIAAGIGLLRTLVFYRLGFGLLFGR
jgi:hypothetical protein